MKIKSIVLPLILIAGLALVVGCATEKSQAELMTKAKVSRADAEKVALTKAEGGTVKEAELEEEKGRLVWSFDIKTPGTKDITEVLVDAVTGEIVGVEKETEEKEAKEKK